MELKDSTFLLVSNIPESFRSANLRTYFSQFVEKKLFVCFHYRHRPEKLLRHNKSLNTSLGSAGTNAESASSLLEGSKGGNVTTKCCVVAVGGDAGRDFVKMYQYKNWACSDGSLLPGKVRISKLSVMLDSSRSQSGKWFAIK